MDPFLLVFIQAFLLLFVALDTIGNIPVFFILTKKMPLKKRRKNVKIALLLASGLLVLFLLFGEYVLRFFAISIGDFRIAGGIILAIIGLKLVLNLRLLENRAEKYQNAIIPMATPLVTGPAAITAVIVNTATYGLLISALAVIANLLIVWVILTRTDFFFRLFGRQGADVLSKIFGIILVAIGIGFIRGGV
ncbi:MAG: MarC family protein [Nanoarchaeota archaeon]